MGNSHKNPSCLEPVAQLEPNFDGIVIGKNFIPHFSNFSLAAILVGNRDHRTQFWNGATQGPFHQSLVAIGPVVSEEKIKM
jgi:hypothetical protein